MTLASCRFSTRLKRTCTLGLSLFLLAPGARAAEKLYNDGSVTYSRATELNARLLTDQACELINREDYAPAVAKLEGALVLRPNLASAHANLGLALNRMGRVEEAISHLRQAVRLAPREPAPLLTIANAYQRSGQLSAALYSYARFLLYFPNDKDAPQVKGLIAGIKKELERGENIHSTSAAHYAEHATCEKNLRWLIQSRPLKVFISEGVGVHGSKPLDMVAAAFKQWESVGCFRFQFVSSDSDADIVCLWVDQASALSNPAEGGEARLTFKGNSILKAKLSLLTVRGNGVAASPSEICSVALHEIGHCLGIVGHSPVPCDIMYFSINSEAGAGAVISSRDAETLRQLYPSEQMLTASTQHSECCGNTLGQSQHTTPLSGAQRTNRMPAAVN